MNNYKVSAEVTIPYAIWICAKNAKEALQKAKEIDREHFCDMSDDDDGTWRVLNKVVIDNSEGEVYTGWTPQPVDIDKLFNLTLGNENE